MKIKEVSNLSLTRAVVLSSYKTIFGKTKELGNISKNMVYKKAYEGKKCIGEVTGVVYEYYGYIHFIRVIPEFIKRGAGKELLRTLIGDLKDKGARFATLIVEEADTEARGFYENMGFKYDDSSEGSFSAFKKSIGYKGEPKTRFMWKNIR